MLHWAKELFPEDWAHPCKRPLVSFDSFFIFSFHEKADVWREFRVWVEENLVFTIAILGSNSFFSVTVVLLTVLITASTDKGSHVTAPYFV